MCRNGLGWITVFLLAVPFAFSEEPRSISDAKSTIAIYRQDWGLASSGGPKLIFCVWDDGTVIWSHDREVGGTPYYESKIKPELVGSKLDKLVSVGLLDSKDAKTGGMVVVDGQFTTIFVRHKGKQLELSTSHEPIDLMEMLDSSYEVEASKKGKFSKAVDRINESAAPFHLAWLQLQVTALGFTPPTGKKTKGEMRKREGKLSWVSE